jgi:transcription elongation factor Elf1
MKKKKRKLYISPKCPYCGNLSSRVNWQVSVADEDFFTPVECRKCEKYYRATAIVRWKTNKIAQ